MPTAKVEEPCGRCGGYHSRTLDCVLAHDSLQRLAAAPEPPEPGWMEGTRSGECVPWVSLTLAVYKRELNARHIYGAALAEIVRHGVGGDRHPVQVAEEALENAAEELGGG
jgi:hypothetical protein